MSSSIFPTDAMTYFKRLAALLVLQESGLTPMRPASLRGFCGDFQYDNILLPEYFVTDERHGLNRQESNEFGALIGSFIRFADRTCQTAISVVNQIGFDAWKALYDLSDEVMHDFYEVSGHAGALAANLRYFAAGHSLRECSINPNKELIALVASILHAAFSVSEYRDEHLYIDEESASNAERAMDMYCHVIDDIVKEFNEFCAARNRLVRRHNEWAWDDIIRTSIRNTPNLPLSSCEREWYIRHHAMPGEEPELRERADPSRARSRRGARPSMRRLRSGIVRVYHPYY